MPIRDILVRLARSHVEHDDSALSLDVVSISKTSKLFLTGGVPAGELDLAKVGLEK